MIDSFSVVTWNVNSLRARMEHVLRWMGDHRPHVLCLQETKVSDEQFPAEPLQELGYEVAYYGQKSYNGVAIASLSPIEDVLMGFQGDGGEEQKRLIAATIRGVRVVNSYVPQGSSLDSPKFPYKLEFLAQLAEYFQSRHDPREPLVWVGDINVAPAPADVFDAQEMDGQVCYHPAEREALEKIRAWGFDDQFRKFEQGDGHFSWWDYRAAAFRRNRGLRIDLVWATAPLSERAVSCWMDREERSRERASDHIPVMADYDWPMD
ncbi:MAG: exodeoxyribonuclease III [SAR324 cluster bacterium]|nr:exodeoxyribonuclease III [SAR324 cluster bacterium]MCZ6556161.1 exodeoxyribonuclease III [SAR324 cluster bacterium]MCZ6644925.1 exodeoxyribonuclease III [SAR324 cluster bacterium]MCZ6841333.1 exodeoxyribonuclease III [SAR324 cluster bacterium]